MNKILPVAFSWGIGLGMAILILALATPLTIFILAILLGESLAQTEHQT